MKLTYKEEEEVYSFCS